MKIVRKTQFKKRKMNELEELRVVKTILSDVKREGDKAVKKYTKKFDKIELEDFSLSWRDIKNAYKQVDTETLKTIKKAAKNIEKFARKQLENLKNFQYSHSGVTLGQKIVPIERVGCYVPGGNYPLPSTALMTIIPAKVAGVKEIIVCSPPKISPYTIVAADLSGASKIYQIGGVQAIAAMTYGTETISRVNKIVGPGNKYVTAAKKEVYGLVGIDMLAGPTEVLIIADNLGNPSFIAADMLAQAEHDVNAIPNLITFNRKFADRVNFEIREQLKNLETRNIAEKALKNGNILIVKTKKEAIDLANYMAPEHLELQVRDPKNWRDRLKNYGSLFLGKNSAEVFGDYCSGINHTLPTSGASKYRGGLSVLDFVKVVTWQSLTKKGVKTLQPIASKFGEIEGLDAHRKSAEIRG